MRRVRVTRHAAASACRPVLPGRARGHPLRGTRRERLSMTSPPAAPRRVGARLPPLLVAAERVASTVAQGVHGRRRVGQGDSFWQFRRFVAGDPIARIDWRQSAKSGRPVPDGWFIRETEWEAAQTVCLWRDASPSMRWHSRGSDDREARTRRPAAAGARLAAAARRRARAADARKAPARSPAAAAWTGWPRTSPAPRRTMPACRRTLPLPRHASVRAVRRLPVAAGGDPGDGRPAGRGAGHRLPAADPRSGRDAAALRRPHPLPRPGA